MPDFYHYTCRNNIEGIFRSGFIFPGKAVVNPNEVKQNYAVCLTSDESQSGHGLPDGREIWLKRAVELNVVQECEGEPFSANHTKYRIKITIPDNDPNLIYLPTLLAAWPDLLRIMQVTAYYPYTGLQSLQKGLDLLETGRLKGKAHTWWYYLGAIPLDWFVEIGSQMTGDFYMPETPDKFQERLGGRFRKQ